MNTKTQTELRTRLSGVALLVESIDLAIKDTEKAYSVIGSFYQLLDQCNKVDEDARKSISGIWGGYDAYTEFRREIEKVRLVIAEKQGQVQGQWGAFSKDCVAS